MKIDSITKRWKLKSRVYLLALAGGGLIAPVSMIQGQGALAIATPAALAAKARTAGATHVNVRQRNDGGIVLHGQIEERNFVIDVPPHWQGSAAQFVRPYSFPGMSLAVPKDLVDQSTKKDPPAGFPIALYKHGYAVGQTVYDKSGLAMESGTQNNVRLKQVFDGIGATKVLMMGVSMGGSTVMSVIDHNPGMFDGAITACGATDNWPDEVSVVMDMRAVYDYFTSNTKYELPGSKNLSQSALNTVAPVWISSMKLLYFGIQAKRVLSPVDKLFADAQKDPKGQAAQIIANVASAAGSRPDPGSFTWRILLGALGADDIRQTYGGNIYSNREKVYHADGLSAAENSTLNAKIARVDADPAAVLKSTEWHASTGRMTTPTLTMHNRYDALMPYSEATGLGEKVHLAGNEANLLQLAVPPKQGDVLLTKLKGYTHCGFTAEQVQYEISLADEWVRTKQKPEIKPEYRP
jgi:pimeloyl-ACP methyl ester carboxylesterase